MHLHGLRDVLQDHRLHVFIAVFEEGRLPLNDAARHFEQRFIADLKAADEPARFLQLRAQHGVIRGTADQAGIALVDANARQARGIDLDCPAALGASHEDVGDDVFRGHGVHARAGARLTGAHQHQRVLHFLFCDAQLPPQQRVLLIRDLIQIARCDQQRCIAARCVRRRADAAAVRCIH